MSKDAFGRELLRRSPLAAAVLGLYDFVLDDTLLGSIWESGRGRCYEDVLTFPQLLGLVRDALVRHGGSAHRLFMDLESRSAHPIDESNFYRKLANMPVGVSQALLRQCTGRLVDLLPGSVVSLPACFDAFRVVVADGKVVKRVAGKLKPARGYAGALLGAKALVAMDARKGLALAFSSSLDGMSNDVPLVPALMPQLHEVAGSAALLTVWDRAFDDPKTMSLMSQRPGDKFVVRTKQKANAVFTVESAVEGYDRQGRRVLDEIGMLGKDKRQVRVRRITLFRNANEQEEDVVLLTNLLAAELASADDVLELYRHRWGIEQVFQQVTQTFSLEHLIGSSPKATLFQLCFCLLLYNLMQVVKAYVAEDGKVLATAVSMHYLFDNVRKELQAWAYHTDGSWQRVKRDARQMAQHLRTLLKDSWNPIKYAKASDKKPRGKPRPKLRLRGGHTSVQRVLNGTAKVVAK